MGFLMPNNQTENITLGVVTAGGNFVRDTISTRSAEAHNKLYDNKTERHEFFLVHNITGEDSIINSMASGKGDGIIGLSPGFSGEKSKPTYVEYLKKIGAITQNAFSLLFDTETYDKSKIS
jgi:hypothetical protein